MILVLELGLRTSKPSGILVDFDWIVNRLVPESHVFEGFRFLEDPPDAAEGVADEAYSEPAAADRARKVVRTSALNRSGCSCSGIIRQ